jgi:3-oxoadipate enol-lactonase
MPLLERPNKPPIFYQLDDYTDPWKNAPAVLLQHGFGRSSQFWYSWVPYLSRYYKVLRPDLRGCGNSAAGLIPEQDISLDYYIEDFNCILDHLGIDSVHYCGEAMGGILGAAIAARNPDRIRTLSLIATPVRRSSHDGQVTAYGHDSRMDAVKKMGVKAWAEASGTGRRFPPDTSRAMLDWYAEERARAAGPMEVLSAMFRWVSDFDLAPFLSQVKAPVLAIYPSSSSLHEESHFQLLKDELQDLRLVLFPTQYHGIQYTHPAACANEVLHFAAQFDGFPCHE